MSRVEARRPRPHRGGNGARQDPIRKARKPGQRVQWWIAGIVSCALIATVAVIANGYDARETPREEPGVWVARESGQYARVNTDTGEIDTVRRVTDPSGVLQVGSRGAVLSNGNGKAWALDGSNPVDLVESAPASGSDAADDAQGDDAQGDSGSGTDAKPVSNSEAEGAAAVRMPEGVRDVVSAGRFVAVRTEPGAVYVGELAPEGAAESTGAGTATGAAGAASASDLGSRLESLQRIEPLTDEAGSEAADAEKATQGAADGSDRPVADTEAADYRATAIALSNDGLLGIYSADAEEVRRYDVPLGEFVQDAAAVPAAASRAEAPQLALVEQQWVLLDSDTGDLWREGGAAAKLDLEGAPRLQASGEAGGSAGSRADGSVLVADAGGLFRVSANGKAVRELEARGTPAQPVYVGGRAYAAWLGQNSATLWDSEDGDAPLEMDDAASDVGDLLPVFRSNGARAVLNEMRTGMLWTLPSGAPIPLSQWTISDPPKQDRGTVVVDDVTEQVPPTAVADEFGVRPGTASPVPVLLNDFDANKRDVLTIVPESLSEKALPASFGTLQLTPDGQSISVTTKDGASGSATFSYRITDGALVSAPATVTLTAVGEQTNTGPEWCPVQGCQRAWRVPPVAPGGTLIAQVLDGWVDPEGDVMTLSGVEVVRDEDPVRALVTADGRLAVRHTDANAGASESTLRVQVRDGRGVESVRELQLAVVPEAAPEFTAEATTIRVGRQATVMPLKRVAGGSGSYELLDAVAPNGGVRVTPHSATGAVDLVADAVGSTTVTVTVRDTVTRAEVTGQLRVTATPAGPPLTLPTLRAFVRPLADTSVEVLDAIPDSETRPLVVQDAEVVDGELQANVMEHSKVRVAGSTADGAAGRIGAVDVTVSEGDTRAVGRLTVFQVPENGGAGAVAVADTASVRAGGVVDISVLDNDVAAPGERLMLHPEIVGSGTKGELAFASGNVLRYLAPKKPGTYRLSYTAFGASDPTTDDVGTVIVQVLPQGANRDPQPVTVTARVSQGATGEVRVPLSGVDPDGDRLRLLSVDSNGDAGISAEVSGTGAGFSVSATSTAKLGATRLEYAVRDNRGGSATAALNVIVVPAENSGALIAATDRLRLTPGTNPALVLPTQNDVDPAGGSLKITSVVPNVVGDEKSAEYRALADRLDLSGLKRGEIRVKPGQELGTATYRYTVKSSKTQSTAVGIIVVETSERVGAQAPAVEDTVLNVRERGELASKGVDVVTGKVQWSTGDPSKLKLSLWSGAAKTYSVRGSRILGEYLPDGDTVVFRLSGTDVSGKEVSTYGMLYVPPLDDLRLTLKPGAKPISVDENAQAQADVRDFVDVSSGDRIELRRGSFPVGRAQATCEAVSSDQLRYTAGREAPWTDSCLIDARLVGQKRWTALSVPVTIVPKEPVVQTSALARTVGPGSTETIELADMVSWQGGRKGDASRLRFDVSGGGSLFKVKQSGGSLEVAAEADALPGSQEVLSVSVTGAGESRSPLTLTIGQAPRDLPVGATVPLQCTVGKACQAQLVGVAGEHDPFAGKSGGGLKLLAVNGGGCAFGTFARTGDSGVTVSWPGGRDVGGTCKVGFTVRDAQGRTGEGTIEFDAQGLPGKPSIQQTGYTKDSATFTVTLGGRQAHPAVTGVTLGGGGTGSCTAAGTATYQCVASGLTLGEEQQFSATASNAVGVSEPSTAVTAWAYAAPATPRVTVEPIKDQQNANQGTGGIRVTVNGSNDTKQFALASDKTGSATLDGPNGSREYRSIGVGSITFTATPVTRFKVPNIGGGTGTGTAGTGSGFVYGAPILKSAGLTSTGAKSALASYVGQGAHNGEAVDVSYSISKPFAAPKSCVRGGQSSPEFNGLKTYLKYTAMVCMSSDYGVSTAMSPATTIGQDLEAPKVTYTISNTPVATTTGGVRYDLVKKADGTADLLVTKNPDATLKFSNTGDDTFELAQSITVTQCIDANEPTEFCSEPSNVLWKNAPDIVTIERASATTCYNSAKPPNEAALRALFTFTGADSKYAKPVAGTAANGVMPVTISWGGWGNPYTLSPAQVNVPVCVLPPPTAPSTAQPY